MGDGILFPLVVRYGEAGRFAARACRRRDGHQGYDGLREFLFAFQVGFGRGRLKGEEADKLADVDGAAPSNRYDNVKGLLPEQVQGRKDVGPLGIGG